MHRKKLMIAVLAAFIGCVQTTSKNPGRSRPPVQDPIGDPNQKTPPPTVDTPPPPGPKSDTVVTPKTGMATHFEALGTPTGGCGVAFENLDTPDFVALNVQHTPGDYTTALPRPIPASQAALIGAWDNGRNCGRWILVTIGDICTGLNDGQKGKGFCRGATGTPWVADSYNGATLPMIIADSCQDDNAWCRDDRDHLDLSTASLSRFKKNDQLVGPLLPDHWGNRKVSWHYIKAPFYQGDLEIGFVKNAQRYWAAVVITNLEQGIHGVEALIGKTWKKASMVGDNGQVYVLPTEAQSPYQIRVFDAEDKPVANGRIYRFSFPPTCGDQCTLVRTPVTYDIVNP